jgi:hypothetical protein
MPASLALRANAQSTAPIPAVKSKDQRLLPATQWNSSHTVAARHARPARARRLPLTVVDVLPGPDVPQAYRHKLVLCRDDQHVAWRGDAVAGDAGDLVAPARRSQCAKGLGPPTETTFYNFGGRRSTRHFSRLNRDVRQAD